MFDEIIDNNQNNIIDTLSELIKFPSVSNETNNPEFPFDKNCSSVLEFILDKANKMGFRTKNVDGYCGYIEFGEGEELVGIIGHLDVVPALEEDGWTTPPFTPSIREGKLYGRGSIDDKGPVIASLYAMKAIMDSAHVSKRVRLILGLNEEKDWKCIEYYKTHEEWPNIGFSPDANFPAIYAEKGILSLSISNDFSIKGYSIEEINCNNNALNVVPKYCSITLISSANIIQTISSSNENIKISYNDNRLKIESFGKASHAAHPEDGVNAITNLVKFLIDNFEFENNYLSKIYNLGLFEITSPNFLSNEKIEDESGILTSNVAVLDYNNNKLIIRINLRVPVNTSLNEIVKKYQSLNNDFENLEVNELGRQEPLFVDKGSYLVKTLVDIFNKKTGQNAMPIAIGGGTYARAFKNFVSYGATMPGDKDMCHQVDEFIEIDKLILTSKIYAEAIYELSK